MLALLDTLTFPETMTILVLALVVLGPEKLPDMARSAGKWMSKIREVAANLQSEVADVMDDPAMKPLRELGEFAASPRTKLADMARSAMDQPTRTPEELAAEAIAEAEAATAVEAARLAEAAQQAPAAVATGDDHPMVALSPQPEPPVALEADADAPDGPPEPSGPPPPAGTP